MAAKEPTVMIKYVGPKAFMIDDFTGHRPPAAWNGYGDVQEVPESVAEKYKIHPGEFAVYDPEAEAAAKEAALIEANKQAEADALEAQAAADEAAQALKESEDAVAAFNATRDADLKDPEAEAAAKAKADEATAKAEAAAAKALAKSAKTK